MLGDASTVAPARRLGIRCVALADARFAGKWSRVQAADLQKRFHESSVKARNPLSTI
ncbi:hypothetical protein CCE01nite_24360 [Cellulomonas cellasea]|uniref:Uncharacterized protein n=1 Tax=Cellulomonas cellasea TaxID=43670 RepID=A0A4Y3KXB2_9CELL|nr:hypothetical protein CCE01nite_24360 [Cellulomonas cellasea]